MQCVLMVETKNIDPKEKAAERAEATNLSHNSGDWKFCGTQHPPRKCPASDH